MTDKKKPTKKKKRTKKESDPTNAVPLEGSEEKPEQAASAAPKTEKKKSASKPDSTPTAAEKEEDNGKEKTTTGPLSDCKVYGQPDLHHKKCRLCKDLESCLAIELLSKKKKGREKQPAKGKSFIGFQKGSQKAAFATHIAKQPTHMRDIKSAPWNKKELTWYDTFNELRRNTTEDGEPLPLATKNKDGVMCILEKNLTKEQREKMKEEVKEFPY